MTARQYLPAVGILVAVLLGALVLAGAAPSNVDDGFIVLVYARHFAETGRIYWNAGEGAVDGFTSMLDMLVKAAAGRMASGDYVRNAHIVAIAAHLASVAAGAVLVQRAFGARARGLAVLVGTAFAFNFALTQATSFLLEGPIHVLLSLLATGVLVLEDPSRRSTRVALVVLWTLLGLARPEGMLVALIEGLWFAFVVARRDRWSPLVATVVLFGAYLAWHRAYFGALAPNTFYAKSSDSRWQEVLDGAAYVLAYARASAASAVLLACVFAAPLAALAPRAWRDRASRRRFAGAALAACVAGLEVIVEGGDGYEGGRFLAAPIALVLFALALAVDGLVARLRLVPAVPLALVVATGIVRGLAHPGERLERIAHWPLRTSDFGCELAVSDVVASRASTVAQTDFQRLKFYRDDLRVIDLMGLNDRVRAHGSSPRQNLWGKGGSATGPATNADVLELGTRAVQAQPMARYSPARIARDEAVATTFLGFALPEPARDGLASSYATVSIPICGAYLNVFVRSDLAARFTDVALVHRSPR